MGHWGHSGSACRRRRGTGIGLRGTLALGSLLALLPGSAASAPDFHGFYRLSFDRYGQLSSPYERDLAIAELRDNPQVERVIVLSYGWANDGADRGYGALRRIVEGVGDWERTAVIGVGWDSSQTGIRKLLNDLVPLPTLADFVAEVPDRVLFPLSFWSKSAMADRIGYGGLRSALNQIFAEAYPPGRAHPDVYLVGHSFGTRVLAGLLKRRFGGFFSAQVEPFESLEHVRGTLLIQPALVVGNLPRDTPFPVVVTQNEHDHANGMLFPIGNLVVNSYAFTTVEALIQKRLIEPVEDTLVGTAGAAARQTGRLLGGGRAGPPESTPPVEAGAEGAAPGEEADPGAEATRAGDSALQAGMRAPVELAGTVYRATRRTGAELLSIPGAVAFTLVATPIYYLDAQRRSLMRDPLGMVRNTLAQLPGVEVAIGGIDRLIGREVPSGRRDKGLFSVGALGESFGRVAVPGPFARDWAIYRPDELDASGSPAAACGLPRCEGLVLVDISDLSGDGLFGDLRRPLVRYTVGWFDIVGAHSAYEEPETRAFLILLFQKMLAGPEASAE